MDQPFSVPHKATKKKKKTNPNFKRSKLNRQLSFDEGAFQASCIPSNLPSKKPSANKESNSKSKIGPELMHLHALKSSNDLDIKDLGIGSASPPTGIK